MIVEYFLGRSTSDAGLRAAPQTSCITLTFLASSGFRGMAVASALVDAVILVMNPLYQCMWIHLCVSFKGSPTHKLERAPIWSGRIWPHSRLSTVGHLSGHDTPRGLYGHVESGSVELLTRRAAKGADTRNPDRCWPLFETSVWIVVWGAPLRGGETHRPPGV